MVSIGKSSHQRILLVEDDSATAQSIELALQERDFDVYTTDLGTEGVDRLKLYAYDACLLDLNLPDMSGYEVLKVVRSSGVETPILIVSGMASVEDKVRGLSFGANDYMTKPFHFDELVARIHNVTRNSGLALAAAQLAIEEERKLLQRTSASGSIAKSPADVFVQKMFHDINSYLSALRGLEEIQKGRIFSSIQFRRAVVCYSTLIASSTEQARLYGHGKDPIVEVATPSEIIDTLDKLCSIIFPKRMSIRFSADKRVAQLRLRTAKRLLLAVLLGLLHNAYSYGRSKDGKSHAIFDVRPSKDSNCVIFRVADKGPGISEVVRSKLFKEPVSSSGGRGVDMYFSKKTADRFGWTLRFGEMIGFSTVFELVVPVADS